MLAVGFSFYSYGTQAYAKGQSRFNVQQNVRMVGTFIADELRYASEIEILNAVPTSFDNNYSYIYATNNNNGSVIYRTSGVEEVIPDISISQGLNFILTIKKADDKLIQVLVNGINNSLSFDILTEINTINLEDEITGSEGVAIKYKPPLSVGALNISSAPPPAGTVEVPYSHTFAAIGGKSPYTFTADGLPGWLSLDSNTGKVTGTPSAEGLFTFAISVTDSADTPATRTRDFTVYIYTTQPLSIDTTSPSNAIVGEEYSHTFTASGGDGSYSFEMSGSDIPGLNFSAGGVLSGTPLKADSYNFSVMVEDGSGKTDSENFELIVKILPLAFVAGDPPDGKIDTKYPEFVFRATGGVPPYSFSVAPNNGLPTGLYLNKDTGELSGTPTSTGNNKFNIIVTDSDNKSVSESYTIKIYNK